LQTAETLTALATIRGRLGRLPEAQELYEQALLVYRRLCGPDDPRTLLLQNQLAGTYLQQENYAQASVVFSEVLAGLRRQPDSDPANQVRVMVNLGAALAKQGEVGDAIRVYEELLALLPKTSAVEGFDASAIARLLEELRQGRTDMINLQPGGKP
jgi:tetratricopeptide (TPR) repeat protein